MTEQSLKTISKSNRDLKCTQALIMGGGHLGNKMADAKIILLGDPLEP